MKIEECYAQMGADYTAVLGRLQSAALIQKFMLLFPKDPTYQELKQALIKMGKMHFVQHIH